MAYNIDSIDIISGQLTLPAYERQLLEEQLTPRQLPCDFEWDRWCDDEGRVTAVLFYGEGSGNAYHAGGLAEILSRTTGRADLLLCWEGGDFYSGLRVDEGVVTEHEVVMRLGDVVND